MNRISCLSNQIILHSVKYHGSYLSGCLDIRPLLVAYSLLDCTCRFSICWLMICLSNLCSDTLSLSGGDDVSNSVLSIEIHPFALVGVLTMSRLFRAQNILICLNYIRTWEFVFGLNCPKCVLSVIWLKIVRIDGHSCAQLSRHKLFWRWKTIMQLTWSACQKTKIRSITFSYYI